MPKTVDKYDAERLALLDEIYRILEITDTNRSFSLKKLDEDIDKQGKILELIPEMKKYFLCSKWTYFSNKNRGFKRGYLCLIKGMMRDMNVELTSSTLITKIGDNKTKCETYYIFN